MLIALFVISQDKNALYVNEKISLEILDNVIYICGSPPIVAETHNLYEKYKTEWIYSCRFFL